ncbi:MAG TPA: hypothetical protein VGM29_07575 [Polyangiaceae bacterium]|jgi:hypothetical protein
MKSGFGHFDSSHRENFCAALLLLTMEVDEAVRALVSSLVRTELGINPSNRLLGFGREARLDKTDDDNYARVDIWLLFDAPDGNFYAFVEVKTREDWNPQHVAHQVRDQTERKLARSARTICGCVLLAPEPLCRRAREHDKEVRFITWSRLLADMAAVPSPSAVTTHAIRHLEEKLDRPAGLDHPMTLEHFERATATIACLRQFLADCVTEIGGSVHGVPLYLTPGDGKPRRSGDWAWHGLAVPFALDGQKGRLGIYKYADAPPGEASALGILWLEAYVGETDTPVALTPFAPPTLATQHLDAARADFKRAWTARNSAASEKTTS